MAVKSHGELLIDTIPVHVFNVLPAMVARATVVGLMEELSLAEGRDPVDLPPLDQYIDTEALNDILVPDTPFFDQDEITFEYADWEVTLTREGDVTVSS